MNRIDRTFKTLKAKRKKAFIAYVTAGDPDLDMTGRLILGMSKSGVDIIELGVPFSDPIADGPTIQAASQRALAKGVTVEKIFGVVKAARKRSDIPIVLMTYYNPVLRYGLNDFFVACRKNGVDGVIVPDIPVEESSSLIKAARASDIDTIFLVAPTSTPSRVRDIVGRSRGFVYYVSLTGVTGACRALPSNISSDIRRVRSASDKPVAVGFGVSNAAQAAAIARVSDGVIVGSAIVNIISEKKDVLKRVSRFTGNLAKAIHNA